MAVTNLGRIKGSMIYTGEATDAGTIASELQESTITPLEGDIYIVKTGPIFKYAKTGGWTQYANFKGPQGTAAGIDESVTVDAASAGSVGTPTVSAAFSGEDTNKHLTLTFSNLKGAPGAAAGFDTPTATASSLDAGATPTVKVDASGTDTSKVFAFTFGIPKGEKGDKGETGTAGANGADGKTPTFSINESGELIATYPD